MVCRQGAAVLFSCTFSPLCFVCGAFPAAWVLKLQESSTQSLIETVVIPPVSRKEVNFKHVSRQERREREKKLCFGPQLEA